MKIKCKLIISSLALFILTTNISFSQDTTFIAFPKESALKKGNYALVFELGTIFRSSGFFEAFTLTAKKHLTDNLALRFSFGGNMSEGNGDQKNNDNQGFDITRSAEDHYYSLQTSINFQYFIKLNSKIKPFFSLGPYGEYEYSGYLYSYDYVKDEIWGVGIFASFGLEMFIMDNVSLIGEYILKATYGKSLFKSDDPNYINSSYRGLTEYKIRLNTARLGFSVYF
jgi:hypothetical protein